MDVSAKPATRRTARAQAFVRIRPEVLGQLPRNPKGNPLEIARIEAAYARFGERFARRILTDRELERYHARRATRSSSCDASFSR